MDGGFHHLDGGGAGFQPDAVPPALLDDLRLFQRELVNGGHDDAIPGGLHLLEGGTNFLVLPAGLCQREDAGHQPGLVADLQPGLLTEHLIKDFRLQDHRHPDDAVREVHPAESGLLDGVTGQRGPAGGREVFHPGHLLGKGHGGRVHFRLERGSAKSSSRTGNSYSTFCRMVFSAAASRSRQLTASTLRP